MYQHDVVPCPCPGEEALFEIPPLIGRGTLVGRKSLLEKVVLTEKNESGELAEAVVVGREQTVGQETVAAGQEGLGREEFGGQGPAGGLHHKYFSVRPYPVHPFGVFAVGADLG
jgi:hypothetical protein